MNMTFNRRTFLKGAAAVSAAAAGGCLTSTTPAPHFRKPGEKLNFAAIGAGGKGLSDWTSFVRHGENLVCLCDVDRGMLDNALATYQKLGGDPAKVKCYADYRKMLDENPHLDAVIVTSPDHMHATQAIRAMRMGMNVYVQKPLVRTLWELDRFGTVAREAGVLTQMGNQGSSAKTFRRGVEVIRSGMLGDIREAHVWTNRPVWPQGHYTDEAANGPAEAVPAGFDWDLWLGTAKPRNFRLAYPKGTPQSERGGVYHRFNWRSFYDFGTGALGDMACHLMNLPFRGLELGAVTAAECAHIEDRAALAYPMRSAVTLTFKARKSRFRAGACLPEVKLTWYDGRIKPAAELMPQAIAVFKEVPLQGCLLIGDKGMLLSTGGYGLESFIALKGEDKVKSIYKHEACLSIPQHLPTRPEKAEAAHYPEFIDAVKGIGPVIPEVHSRCYADIEHSIPLVESMLVGCVAQRLGEKVVWDSANRLFDGAAANDLIRPYMRSGFEM